MAIEILKEVIEHIETYASLYSRKFSEKHDLLKKAAIFGYHLRDSVVDVMNRMINKQQELLQQKDQRIKELEEMYGGIKLTESTSE